VGLAGGAGSLEARPLDKRGFRIRQNKAGDEAKSRGDADHGIETGERSIHQRAISHALLMRPRSVTGSADRAGIDDRRSNPEFDAE